MGTGACVTSAVVLHRRLERVKGVLAERLACVFGRLHLGSSERAGRVERQILIEIVNGPQVLETEKAPDPLQFCLSVVVGQLSNAEGIETSVLEIPALPVVVGEAAL